MGWGHLLGLLGVATVGAAPAPEPGPGVVATSTLPSPFTGTFDVIPRITCITADGRRASGSGVRISDDLVITAHHVVQDKLGVRSCAINNQPAKLIYAEPGRDVAIIQIHLGIGFRAPISCEGFKPGQRYIAAGYPGSAKEGVFETLIATNQKIDKEGEYLLNGKIYPGMSGGATLNADTGELVGINVAANKDGRPWAWAVPLTETYLCR